MMKVLVRGKGELGEKSEHWKTTSPPLSLNIRGKETICSSLPIWSRTALLPRPVVVLLCSKPFSFSEFLHVNFLSGRLGMNEKWSCSCGWGEESVTSCGQAELWPCRHGEGALLPWDSVILCPSFCRGLFHPT